MYFVDMLCYMYAQRHTKTQDDPTNAYFSIKEEKLFCTNGILTKLQPFAVCEKLRKIYWVQRKKRQRVQNTKTKYIHADTRGHGV